MFSCECCKKIFKNFFHRTPPVAASEQEFEILCWIILFHKVVRRSIINRNSDLSIFRQILHERLADQEKTSITEFLFWIQAKQEVRLAFCIFKVFLCNCKILCWKAKNWRGSTSSFSNSNLGQQGLNHKKGYITLNGKQGLTLLGILCTLTVL